MKSLPFIVLIPFFVLAVTVSDLHRMSGGDRLASGEELDAVSSTAASAKSAAESASKDAARVVQLLQGEDFRVTVTNYNSSVNAPMASFDARYSDGTTSSWHTVWTETNGLARTKSEVLSVIETNNYTRAESDDRFTKWGKWDSTTGEKAPDGMVQVSAPNGLMISGGAGFSNYVAPSGGSYWIFRGTGNLSMTDTGTLDILDNDGNAVFSVVKGDKTLVGADAASISVTSDGTDDTITLIYNVESTESPIIEWTPDLNLAWVQCGADGAPAVSWAHDSAANRWTASVVIPSTIRAGFFRGAYMKGSETYVKSGGPMSLSKLIIGGKTYTLGTAIIDGKTVLTLNQ